MRSSDLSPNSRGAGKHRSSISGTTGRGGQEDPLLSQEGRDTPEGPQAGDSPRILERKREGRVPTSYSKRKCQHQRSGTNVVLDKDLNRGDGLGYAVKAKEEGIRGGRI